MYNNLYNIIFCVNLSPLSYHLLHFKCKLFSFSLLVVYFIVQFVVQVSNFNYPKVLKQ